MEIASVKRFPKIQKPLAVLSPSLVRSGNRR